MTKTPRNSPDSLNEIAASISKLIQHLENREVEGRPLTATEIDAIAGKLQTHVEELAAASKRLRKEKTDN